MKRALNNHYRNSNIEHTHRIQQTNTKPFHDISRHIIYVLQFTLYSVIRNRHNAVALTKPIPNNNKAFDVFRFVVISNDIHLTDLTAYRIRKIESICRYGRKSRFLHFKIDQFHEKSFNSTKTFHFSMQTKKFNLEIGLFLKEIKSFIQQDNVIDDETIKLLTETIWAVNKLQCTARFHENDAHSENNFFFELENDHFQFRRHIVCRLCLV